jgi:hypothetical protein
MIASALRRERRNAANSGRADPLPEPTHERATMATYFSIETRSGYRESVELPGSGETVRFGVGEPGTARSGVWNVWSNKNKSDVYVAARAIAGLLKISLHEGGDWRLQWTGPNVAARYAPGAPHPLERWVRPAEFGPGWTRAISVLIAEEDLVAHPYPEQGTKRVLWAPTPSPGGMAAFHIFVAKPDRGAVESTGFLPMCGYLLPNGEACLLYFATHPLPPGRSEELDAYRQVLIENARAHGVPASASLRGMVYGTGDDGRPMVFDLTLHPDATTRGPNRSPN